MTTKYYVHKSGSFGAENIKYIKYIDGNYFWIYKTGGKYPINDWSKEKCDGFVKDGFWVEFTPKLRNRKKASPKIRYFKHVSGFAYDAVYVEMTDDKHFTFILPDGSRKDMTEYFTQSLPFGQWFIDEGHWIEITEKQAKALLSVKESPRPIVNKIRCFKNKNEFDGKISYLEFNGEKLTIVYKNGRRKIARSEDGDRTTLGQALEYVADGIWIEFDPKNETKYITHKEFAANPSRLSWIIVQNVNKYELRYSPFTSGCDYPEAIVTEHLRTGNWVYISKEQANGFTAPKTFKIRQTRDFEVQACTSEEALKIARQQIGHVWKLEIV